MSSFDDDKSAGEPTEPYKVGPGRPPLETRFKPGQSGNPKGRPPRPKKPLKPHSDFGLSSNTVALGVAYDPIMVREGGELVQLSMLEGVIRAWGLSAIKSGSSLRAERFAKFIQAQEVLKQEKFEAVVEEAYRVKKIFREVAEDCRKRGQPVPPHYFDPEDIVLDPDAGTIRFEGPTTPAMREIWDECLEIRDNMLDKVKDFAGQYWRAKTEKDRERWLGAWRTHLAVFHQGNDWFPDRHKVRLPNELYLDPLGNPIGAPPPFDDAADDDGDNVIGSIEDEPVRPNDDCADAPESVIGLPGSEGEDVPPSAAANVNEAAPSLDGDDPTVAGVKTDWTECIKKRDQAQKTVSASAKRYKEQSDAAAREHFKMVHKVNVNEFDRVNALLPEDLQVELIDRRIDDAALKTDPPP